MQSLPCRFASLACLLFAFGVTQASAQSPPAEREDEPPISDNARARVIGFRLADPTVNQQAFDRAPLPAARGTMLRVMIDNMKAPMVALERERSTVNRFVDSTGRVLRESAQNKEPENGNKTASGNGETNRQRGALRLSHGSPISPDAVISRDDQQLALAFRAPRVPAEDATFVRVQGEVAVRVGIGKTTRTIKDVALKRGAVLLGDENAQTRPADQKPGGNNATTQQSNSDQDNSAGGERAATQRRAPGEGPGTVTIVRVGESNWGAQPMHVHLQLNGQRADRFVSATVIGPSGENIAARQMAPVRMAETIQVPIALRRKVKRATIKLTFYESLEPRRVPVDVKTGLGL